MNSDELNSKHTNIKWRNINVLFHQTSISNPFYEEKLGWSALFPDVSVSLVYHDTMFSHIHLPLKLLQQMLCHSCFIKPHVKSDPEESLKRKLMKHIQSLSASFKRINLNTVATVCHSNLKTSTSTDVIAPGRALRNIHANKAKLMLMFLIGKRDFCCAAASCSSPGLFSATFSIKIKIYTTLC